ncbi:MAG: tetratricopeptide repeat protein [Epsilonproteobacteria bacterium]|nr:tetratricopeptide repeat protein [Campylobacterota bacterium]
MTVFQLLMLGASAYFAFKIYEHIQTLQDPQGTNSSDTKTSSFDVDSLLEDADKAREDNNLDRALAIYSEAKQKDPKNAEILFKMGYTMMLQDRDDEALEYFLESLESDDSNPFAYKEIAKIYAKQGLEEKSNEYNEKARKLDENI